MKFSKEKLESDFTSKLELIDEKFTFSKDTMVKGGREEGLKLMH